MAKISNLIISFIISVFFFKSFFANVAVFLTKYYLPKGIIRNYNFIVNVKNFYDQAIESDIKQYKEIRKLITVTANIILLDVY